MNFYKETQQKRDQNLKSGKYGNLTIISLPLRATNAGC